MSRRSVSAFSASHAQTQTLNASIRKAIITPSVKILLRGDTADYTPATAIAEVVDNSIQAIKDQMDDPRVEVLVEPASNASRNDGASSPLHITVWDNGSGMDEATLQRCFTLGMSQSDELTRTQQSSSITGEISRYGEGVKRAAFYLGNSLTIISKTANSSKVTEATLSRRMLEQKEEQQWEIDIITRDINRAYRLETRSASFTIVRIEELNHRWSHYANLAHELAHIYYYYLHPREEINPNQLPVKLVCNGDSLAADNSNFESTLINSGKEELHLTLQVNLPGRAATVQAFLRYYPLVNGAETLPIPPSHQPTRGGIFNLFPLEVRSGGASAVPSHAAAVDDDDETASTRTVAMETRRPGFEVFWSGRLIPEARLGLDAIGSTLEMLQGLSKSAIGGAGASAARRVAVNGEWLARVKGQIFLPFHFAVTQNKIHISMEHHTIRALREAEVVAVDGPGAESAGIRAVGGRGRVKPLDEILTRWIRMCHEKYDEELTFVAATYDVDNNVTDVNAIKGLMTSSGAREEIRVGDRVEVVLQKRHLFVKVLKLYFEGNRTYGNVSRNDGWIEAEIVVGARRGEKSTLPLRVLRRKVTEAELSTAEKCERERKPARLLLYEGDDVAIVSEIAAGAPPQWLMSLRLVDKKDRDVAVQYTTSKTVAVKIVYRPYKGPYGLEMPTDYDYEDNAVDSDNDGDNDTANANNSHSQKNTSKKPGKNKNNHNAATKEADIDIDERGGQAVCQSEFPFTCYNRAKPIMSISGAQFREVFKKAGSYVISCSIKELKEVVPARHRLVVRPGPMVAMATTYDTKQALLKAVMLGQQLPPLVLAFVDNFGNAVALSKQAVADLGDPRVSCHVDGDNTTTARYTVPLSPPEIRVKMAGDRTARLILNSVKLLGGKLPQARAAAVGYSAKLVVVMARRSANGSGNSVKKSATFDLNATDDVDISDVDTSTPSGLTLELPLTVLPGPPVGFVCVATASASSALSPLEAGNTANPFVSLSTSSTPTPAVFEQGTRVPAFTVVPVDAYGNAAAPHAGDEVVVECTAFKRNRVSAPLTAAGTAVFRKGPKLTRAGNADVRCSLLRGRTVLANHLWPIAVSPNTRPRALRLVVPPQLCDGRRVRVEDTALSADGDSSTAAKTTTKRHGGEVVLRVPAGMSLPDLGIRVVDDNDSDAAERNGQLTAEWASEVAVTTGPDRSVYALPALRVSTSTAQWRRYAVRWVAVSTPPHGTAADQSAKGHTLSLTVVVSPQPTAPVSLKFDEPRAAAQVGEPLRLVLRAFDEYGNAVVDEADIRDTALQLNATVASDGRPVELRTGWTAKLGSGSGGNDAAAWTIGELRLVGPAGDVVVSARDASDRIRHPASLSLKLLPGTPVALRLKHFGGAKLSVKNHSFLTTSVLARVVDLGNNLVSSVSGLRVAVRCSDDQVTVTPTDQSQPEVRNGMCEFASLFVEAADLRLPISESLSHAVVERKEVDVVFVAGEWSDRISLVVEPSADWPTWAVLAGPLKWPDKVAAGSVVATSLEVKLLAEDGKTHITPIGDRYSRIELCFERNDSANTNTAAAAEAYSANCANNRLVVANVAAPSTCGQYCAALRFQFDTKMPHMGILTMNLELAVAAATNGEISPALLEVVPAAPAKLVLRHEMPSNAPIQLSSLKHRALPAMAVALCDRYGNRITGVVATVALSIVPLEGSDLTPPKVIGGPVELQPTTAVATVNCTVAEGHGMTGQYKLCIAVDQPEALSKTVEPVLLDVVFINDEDVQRRQGELHGRVVTLSAALQTKTEELARIGKQIAQLDDELKQKRRALDVCVRQPLCQLWTELKLPQQLLANGILFRERLNCINDVLAAKERRRRRLCRVGEAPGLHEVLRERQERGASATGILGVVAELATVESDQIAQLLAASYRNKMCAVVFLSSEQLKEYDRRYPRLPAVSLESLKRYPPLARPTNHIEGFQCYVIHALELEPQHEHLRDTLFRAIFANTMIFDTFTHALNYRDACIRNRTDAPNILTLDYRKIDAQGFKSWVRVPDPKDERAPQFGQKRTDAELERLMRVKALCTDDVLRSTELQQQNAACTKQLPLLLAQQRKLNEEVLKTRAEYQAAQRELEEYVAREPPAKRARLA